MDLTSVRRRGKPLCALLVGLVLATTGCGAAGAEEEDRISLVMADSFSAKHPVGKGGSQKFLAYMREHGPDVGINIEYFTAGQLGNQTEMLTLIRTRAVDMGFIIPSYLAEDLPLASVGDLPGLSSDPCALSDALLPMMQPGGAVYEKELNSSGIQALWGSTISGLEVMTSVKQITTPADLPGLKVRSAGGVSDRVVDGLGAAPVQLPAGDLYEAIARKTVDGVMTSKYVITSYGLEDEIQYSTIGANLGATTFYMAINPEVWQTLNEDQKRVVAEASAVAQQGTCEELALADTKATEVLKESGVQFSEVNDKHRANWDLALNQVRGDWITALESKGIPAEETLNDLERRLVKEAK
jgi:TRAP-type C4-dicarboxylate transport system substrate-binding protein